MLSDFLENAPPQHCRRESFCGAPYSGLTGRVQRIWRPHRLDLHERMNSTHSKPNCSARTHSSEQLIETGTDSHCRLCTCLENRGRFRREQHSRGRWASNATETMPVNVSNTDKKWNTYLTLFGEQPHFQTQVESMAPLEKSSTDFVAGKTHDT